jgi:hypothetical protein
MAGSGLNAVVPARGGDLVKLLLVRRRLPGARYSTLAATFVPDGICEALLGIALVVWALAHGFLPVPVAPSELPSLDVSFLLVHPFLSTAGGLAVAAGGWLAARWLRRRARGLVAGLRQGVAILRQPRALLVGVLGWQALSRIVRLAALACLMSAFGLPVTPTTAVMVMAAQGAGRIVPLAPVSAGLRVAMLSYGFVELTDRPVDVARVTAFCLGVGATHLVLGLLLSLAILGTVLGTFSPRRALASARAALAERAAVAPLTPAVATAPDGSATIEGYQNEADSSPSSSSSIGFV